MVHDAGVSFRTTVLLGMAAALGSARPALSQVGGPTMVGVQDLAWSADGQKLFFSAMRVKRDYSDYTPDKWAVYRYAVGTGAVARIAASSFSVGASPVEPLICACRWTTVGS